MLIVALLAIAGPLDAPIDARPTVRSEIHRGAEAALNCDTVDNMADPPAYSECISRASAANQQRMSRGYEPFDIGLFYEAAEMMGIKANVSKTEESTKQTASFRRVYAALRDKHHLADAEVEKATR